MEKPEEKGYKIKQKKEDYLKTNALKNKSINSRIRSCSHILRMNEDRIPKVLHMDVK
jgi:hypothetical protein